MKIVILDAATMGRDIDFSPITRLGETVIYPSTSPDEIESRIKDASVVVTNKILLGEKELEKAEKLRLICLFAIGFNNIDINYCKEHNIYVRNVPGYCVESVCQHTFALLFMLIENLRYYDDIVKNKSYSHSGTANHIGMPFNEISGLKWGIIGMGAIGRSVARVASCFGAEVTYSSVSGAVRKEDFENVKLETLLKESDIISVHAPLNDKTFHLIGEKELSMMKKTSVIINVGRGAIIDESALKNAIDSGIIAGAAIDVFTKEPPEADSPIMAVKNQNRIVYSPHIAWASTQARARCVSMTADNIAALINGESLHDIWQ